MISRLSTDNTKIRKSDTYVEDEKSNRIWEGLHFMSVSLAGSLYRR